MPDHQQQIGLLLEDLPPLDKLEILLEIIKQNICLPPKGNAQKLDNAQIDSLLGDICLAVCGLLKKIELTRKKLN